MNYFIEFLNNKDSFGYVVSSYSIAFIFIIFLKLFSTRRTKKFEEEYSKLERNYERKT
tara:strand:- start:2826 stop:2999 length:174 start_codon:yes stop_codon:yes gene_type:complete